MAAYRYPFNRLVVLSAPASVPRRQERIGESKRMAVLLQVLKAGDAGREAVVQEASLTAEPTVYLLSNPVTWPIAVELLERMGKTGVMAMARVLVRKIREQQPIREFIDSILPVGSAGVEALTRALRDETEQVRDLAHRIETQEYENQHEMAKLRESGLETLSDHLQEEELKVKGLQRELANVQAARLEMVRVLGRVQDEPALRALIGMLRDSQEPIRDQARQALVSIGRPAVEALIRELKPDYISPIEADILVEIGHAAVSPLIEAMKRSRSNLEQNVLFRIGQPAVEPVLALLEDPNPEVRFKAVNLLGRMADTRTIPHLTRMLRDPDTPAEHRPRILWVLDRMPDARAVEPILKEMQKPELRRNAIKSLCRMGSVAVEAVRKMDPAVLSPLVEALADEALHPGLQEFLARLGPMAFEAVMTALDRPELRKAAIETLGMAGEQIEVDTLLQLVHDPDNEIRCAILEFLGRSQDERALEPLLAALEDPQVAPHAAGALRHFNAPRAIQALIACLEAEQAETARKAAESLGHIGSPEGVGPLVKAATREATCWVALVALARLGEPAREAVRREGIPLLKALISRLKRVRILTRMGRIAGQAERAAIVNLVVGFGPMALEELIPEFRVDEGVAEAVGRLHSPDSYQFLLKALLSHDPVLRRQAAIALRWFGERSAVPELVEVMEEEDLDLESLMIVADAALRLDAGEAIPALLEVPAAHGEEAVRAVEKVVLAQPAVVIPQLLERLKDESEAPAVIDWLDKFGLPAIDPLLSAFHTASDPGFQRRLVRAMGRIGGDRVIKTLIGQLEGSEGAVQVEIVQALGKIGDRRALQPLKELRRRLGREDPVLEQVLRDIESGEACSGK